MIEKVDNSSIEVINIYLFVYFVIKLKLNKITKVIVKT